MIALKLLDAAFITDTHNHKRDYEKASDEIQEMNNAFDIIELLNVRVDPVINTSKNFVNNRLEDPKDPENCGPHIKKVAKWLSRDPKLGMDLDNKIKQILNDHYTVEQVNLCRSLLEDIT
jgi:hypothetical protein